MGVDFAKVDLVSANHPVGVKKTGMCSEKVGLPMPHSLSNMP